MNNLLLLWCFFYGCHDVLALTIDEFFPFGEENGDTQLQRGDDVSANVQFMSDFLFYGQSYSFFSVRN